MARAPVKYQRHKRINSLPVGIRQGLIDMLKTDTQTRTTARWLQSKGYLSEMRLISVVRAIDRWRLDEPELFGFPIAEIEATVPERDSSESYLQKSADDIDEQVDELKELTLLIRYQWDRLKIDGVLEEGVGKLLPGVGNEVRLLGDLLLKMADLKMKMGIYPEMPKKVLARLEIDDGRQTKEMLDAMLAGPEMGEIIEGVSKVVDDDRELMETKEMKSIIRQGLLAAAKGAVRGVGD